jgi:hypothetical protein
MLTYADVCRLSQPSQLQQDVAARLRELGLPLAEEALDAATGYTLDILISDAAGIAAPSGNTGEFALAQESAAARASASNTGSVRYEDIERSNTGEFALAHERAAARANATPQSAAAGVGEEGLGGGVTLLGGGAVAAAGVGAEGRGGGVTLLGGGAVAVEVDGPFHFRGRSQRPLGSTVAL